MIGNLRPGGLDRYLEAVDTSLLDLPWRERRQIRRDLREHLDETGIDPSGVDPAEYAREIRASRDPGAYEGRPSGVRQLWPTLTEWLLNGISGIALILSFYISWHTIHAIATPSGGVGLVDAYRSALQADLPAPAVMGQNTLGLVVYPAGWLLGQAAASRALRNASPKRRAWTVGVAALLALGLLFHVVARLLA